MSRAHLEDLYNELKDLVASLGEDDEQIEEALTMRFVCPDPGYEYVVKLFLDLDLPIDSKLGNSICSIIVSKEGPQEINGGVNLGRKPIYAEAVNEYHVFCSYCKGFISRESYGPHGIRLLYERKISTDEENLDLPPDEREYADHVSKDHILSLNLFPAKDKAFIQEVIDGIPSVFFNFDEGELENYSELLKDIMDILLEIQTECFCL